MGCWWRDGEVGEKIGLVVQRKKKEVERNLRFWDIAVAR